MGAFLFSVLNNFAYCKSIITRMQPTTPPQKKSFLVPVLIIIIALLVICCAINLYQGWTRTEEVRTSENHVIAPIDTPVEPADGWQTHTSSRPGFSVQFPADWRIRTGSVSGDMLILEDTKHPSIPDTDSSSNSVQILFHPRGSQSANWELGFGGIFWKTINIPEHDALITMSALTEADKVIEDRIAASIRFTSAQ